MKTIVLTLLTLSVFHSLSFAQSDKYQKAMARNVAIFDTAQSAATMQTLLGAFDRIAAVEKTQWLPYYYAGMNAVNLANREPDKSRIDGWADQAEIFAHRADSLSPSNSEVSCLLAMIQFARINVDFMGRGPTYSARGAELLQQALKQNPANPRAMLVLAQLRWSAPAGFGGDKAMACQLASKALTIYNTTPMDGIAPHWGHKNAQKMADKCAQPTTK